MSVTTIKSVAFCLVFAVVIHIATCHDTKESREARRVLSKKYQDLYMKECSSTYDKLRKFAEDCTHELQMVSFEENIITCKSNWFCTILNFLYTLHCISRTEQ